MTEQSYEFVNEERLRRAVGRCMFLFETEADLTHEECVELAVIGEIHSAYSSYEIASPNYDEHASPLSAAIRNALQEL